MHLSTDTPGAQLYYSLDGTYPGTDAAIYDEPFELDKAANLRVVARVDGVADSPVVAAQFRFPDNPCLAVSDVWQSVPVSAQSGRFEFQFEATPQGDEIDSVMGLSHGEAQRYQHLAAIARFNVDGFIDARRGSAYEAVEEVSYEAGQTYVFEFDVDVVALTYDVTVRVQGDDEKFIIADGYEFRTEQDRAYRLDRFSTYAGIGENEVCHLYNPADEPREDDDHGNDSEDVGVGDVGADTGEADGDAAQSGDDELTTTGCACGQGGGAPTLVFVMLLATGVAAGRLRKWAA